MPAGKTLRGVLGGDYQSIAGAAGESGLDLAMLDRFAPWFVARCCCRWKSPSAASLPSSASSSR